MSPREKLETAYALAFHPPTANAAWNDWDRGKVEDTVLLAELLDMASTLHQRLPECPDAAARALRRLARYQAVSRLYRMPSMLNRFRGRLGRQNDVPVEVPAWMVRDIALPVFGRKSSADSP